MSPSDPVGEEVGEEWNPPDGSGVHASMDVTTTPNADDRPSTPLIGPSRRPLTAPPSAWPSVAAVSDGDASSQAELRPAPTEVELVLTDTVSFSSFYRDKWQPVARGLALTLGDPDLAAEATDEAMARAYPRWATLQAYDNPAGWVYRVGLNWARSHHRRIARMIPFVHHETAELGPVTDPAVAEALLRLPLKQRSVVVCRLLLDWSVDDTASALDISPGTVKSRLHRGLQTLESTLSHLR
jgi:RNA polymerase sigma-70 factor (ECF subfamily)